MSRHRRWPTQTFAFTALMPRSDTVVPLSCTVHDGDGDCAIRHPAALKIKTTVFILPDYRQAEARL